MKRLPILVLAQIMNFLEPKDLMLSFMPLNRSSLRILHTRVYVSSYLAIYFKSHSEFPSELDLYQIIKTLAKQPQAEKLSFFGFGTSGGLRGCEDIYWVDNMYHPYSFFEYIGEYNKFNVNTVGVLSSTQVKGKVLRRICKFIESSYSGRFKDIHRWNVSRYSPIYRLRDSFLREKGILALIGCEENNKILKEKQKYLAWLECNRLRFEEIQKRKEDEYVLVDPINFEYANSGRNLFITNNFHFRGPLNYKSPVCAFMIFVSDIYVDIEDKTFDYFNDLRSIQEFELFMNTDFGRNLTISESKEDQDYIYKTFNPCNLDLKPVVWGLYSNEKAKPVDIKLVNYFRGVYLYTKLICRDLRYVVSNVTLDAEYIEVKGFEINL